MDRFALYNYKTIENIASNLTDEQIMANVEIAKKKRIKKTPQNFSFEY